MSARRATVRVLFKDVTKSENASFVGSQNVDVAGRLEEKIVEITFKPGAQLPSIVIPFGFPQYLNDLIEPFMKYLHDSSAGSFPASRELEFSNVTGEISPEDQAVLGKRTFTLIGTPLDFFQALEEELRRAQTAGFFAI